MADPESPTSDDASAPAATRPRAQRPEIGDYAVIGNCRTAALISRWGSIDWLCLPRFDSPSVFAAILDAERGGAFVVAPASGGEVERRYVGDTNVLETTWTTASGRLRVTDLMPVAAGPDGADGPNHDFRPEHEVLRLVECLEGEVEVEAECDLRPLYGAAEAKIVDRGRLGWFFEHGLQAIALRSELPLAPDKPSGVRGRSTLRAGETCALSLAYSRDAPAALPLLGERAWGRLRETLDWWRGWSDRCPYDGPHRQSVMRSALTLKLMTFAPSGAVVAAPTTSLPEQVGGERNWDYRYTWLRDASMTLRALYELGHPDEGRAFLSWLLHATRLTAPRVHALYDVYGESRLPERTLDHLRGYRDSSPVRVGNDACNQLQLDTYGEVVDAAYQFCRRGGRLDRPMARLLLGFGDAVCRRWREPDEGIWEIRAGRRHHTHSKAMCWVAVDRLLRLHEREVLKAPIERFTRERDRIAEEIEQRGFNTELNSYVTVFDGDNVDASLLLLGLYGYAEPTSERMTATCRAIHQRLGHNGLLHRYQYEDGLPAGEGAFGLCSFWGVECMAKEGMVDQASENFDRLCSLSNDVGLYGEEFDPDSGAPLGNFPQAFTHIGLINAALTLAGPVGRRDDREVEEPERPAAGSAP